MKTVVFAYHNIGCAGITCLIEAGYDIQAVFTHVDDQNENTFFESVAELCAEHDLPVFAPSDANHPLWVDRIQKLAPDLIFSFYYRNMICQSILDIPRLSAFNLHGSLLPSYRGRAPINWVLVNGETKTGVTLHKMVSQPDAGDIVAQQVVPITDTDTALTLHQKTRDAAAAMLKDILPKIKIGRIEMQPQDESKASYFGRRTPADGEINWQRSAREITNLVRAVTHPFPGAFSFAGDRKILVWQAKAYPNRAESNLSGTIISLNPLRIACSDGAVEIITGQSEQGLFVRGSQLALELGLTEGTVLGSNISSALRSLKRRRVLILGVNGFIGNHLTERLLADDNFEVHGLDIDSDAISRFIGNPRFHFVEGDISIHSEWLEYHIKKCDVIMPLVAIATPIEYTRNPLRVFELDFEENLKIVRYCVKYRKRILFPSTSEVYGMCQDEYFDEDNSNLTVGPINKQRWIYSISKQLLDRVIWAYGQKHGLQFTLFRPFNWMGPRLDNLNAARIGSSRAITQLILNLVEGTPIKLIDGGAQKRCFTDIREGVEALYRIIQNKDGLCDGKIINIGNPVNEASIKEMAEILLEKFEAHPLRGHFPPFAGFNAVESCSYYGAGYQDVSHRRPSIRNAQNYINWTPEIEMGETIENTLDYFLRDFIKAE